MGGVLRKGAVKVQIKRKGAVKVQIKGEEATRRPLGALLQELQGRQEIRQMGKKSVPGGGTTAESDESKCGKGEVTVILGVSIA